MVAVEINAMVLSWQGQIILICLLELHAEVLASLGAYCADLAGGTYPFDVDLHLGPEISAHEMFCDSPASEVK